MITRFARIAYNIYSIKNIIQAHSSRARFRLKEALLGYLWAIEGLCCFMEIQVVIST